MINNIIVRGNMDYKKLYEKICERGKEKRDLDYSELHHILPKCMGGDDLPNNLSRLSAKEHYLAHWLLHKIYPDNWKISHAFLWMSTENGKNSRTITSRQYNRAKEAMARSCKNRMADLGNPMHRESSRKKISERMMGDNNPMRKFPEKNHVLNGGKTPSMDGAQWFTDGIRSRYFKPGEIIPEGWQKGTAPFPDRGKWITNGKEIRRLKDGQEMPEGFRYGKKKDVE